MRRIRLLHTGTPAPLRITAPAYAAATLGWLAAAVMLVAAAPDLAVTRIGAENVVLAVHLVAVVFVPCAVVAAAWQLLPVMLRNDLPASRGRWLVLLLILAGPLLAVGVAVDARALTTIAATLLGVALVFFLSQLAALVRRAPKGRTLAVNRPAVALALVHMPLAFILGAVAFADGGPEPIGVPYERLLLIHLSLALIGWLTVLIAAVGRTLVPMLGLAAAAPPRRFPAAEPVTVAGLWVFVVGVATSVDAVAAAGVVIMAAGLTPVVDLFVRVVRRGRIGGREGPVAHAAVGLVFLAQAALLGLGAPLGLVADRRAAVAGVVLLGIGWASGVILGHLGKLAALSAWGSWPPGPRPKQADLYPRRVWQVEVTVFAVGAEFVAAGVLLESTPTVRAGAVLLVAAAALAAAGVLETLRRAATLRSA